MYNVFEHFAFIVETKVQLLTFPSNPGLEPAPPMHIRMHPPPPPITTSLHCVVYHWDNKITVYSSDLLTIVMK